MSVLLNPPAAYLTRSWSPEDASALRADADAYPREIGNSSMLNMILEAEAASVPLDVDLHSNR